MGCPVAGETALHAVVLPYRQGGFLGVRKAALQAGGLPCSLREAVAEETFGCPVGRGNYLAGRNAEYKAGCLVDRILP